MERLLQETSRTFALTIPLLADPTRYEVTLAYLLFRVADTLEDATRWDRRKKLAELERLGRLLDHPGDAAAASLAADWTADPPVDHQGYRWLLAELPAVMASAASLSPEAWRLITTHTSRTIRGMASFVSREESGALGLRDLADLRAYCYAVAGIVGEMLTELFLLGRPALWPEGAALRADAATFGEALQLVNILKDSATDSKEGRYYLPPGLGRDDVFAVARRDLSVAAGYCRRLERIGAERGLVAFTALPVLLALASLDRVEERGPGGKLTRDEVARIVAELQAGLERGAVSALLPA
jgi:farnesyl-diphosphate farnesyltransferase